MTVVRSLLFNLLFYLNLIGQLIIYAPVFFIVPERTAWTIVKNWARSSLWLLKYVAGIEARITGQENIPAGSCIIASKHQSFWEVFALIPEVERPTFVLKKELMRIPLFGWFAARMGMIPVERGRRGAAVASMVEGAEKAIAEGRQIVIFPEGTRVQPGAAPQYRPGVFRLYEALGLPVVPVALNSGLYWPRRKFVRRPGTIRAEFLTVIPPGLERDDFLERVSFEIEIRSDALIRKAFEESRDLPMSELVKARLAAEDSLEAQPSS
ncbi:lysophospholipid acyltransferase family protein [Mangrovicella endophytica]|uniref:lysophospholipid acyltransferase family protein n=1 Tax=Mangrovicella endophytica TaxID=2066697 RepID=UPI000C9E4B62|nr:lysophospholipid acyltransferase family protein [Mangrovicella endophytica]